MFFVFESIPDQYKTQEICDMVVYLCPFLIVFCSDIYKTQKMCNEAVDSFLTSLKWIFLVPVFLILIMILMEKILILFPYQTFG